MNLLNVFNIPISISECPQYADKPSLIFLYLALYSVVQCTVLNIPMFLNMLKTSSSAQRVSQAKLLGVHLQPHLLELRLEPGEGRVARILLVLLLQRAHELHGGPLLVEAPGHEARQQRVLREICLLIVNRMSQN